MVNEKDGTVIFTVKVIEGTLERDAVVSFSTTDGSATSTDPADFNAVSDQLFTFSPSTSSNDVTVTIFDDDIVENSEFFFGNLSTTDNAVNLDPSAARVTISETEGDDSKFSILHFRTVNVNLLRLSAMLLHTCFKVFSCNIVQVYV